MNIFTYNLLTPQDQRRVDTGEYLTSGYDYPQTPGHDSSTCIYNPGTQYERINFLGILGLEHGNYQTFRDRSFGVYRVYSFDYGKITIEDFWENYILEIEDPGEREMIKSLIEKSGYNCRIEGEAGFLVVRKKPCSKESRKKTDRNEKWIYGT